MSDDGDYEDYDTTTVNTTIDTTTEYWSSENDYDVAQIMTKRVTYTVYTWLFRVMIMLGLMAVVTFVVCVPVAATLLIVNRRIRSVIVRKRKYWENDEYLLKEVMKKVDKKMKAIEKEKEKQSLEAMKEAKKTFNNLKRMMGGGGGGGGSPRGGRRRPRKKRPGPRSPPPGRKRKRPPPHGPPRRGKRGRMRGLLRRKKRH